MRKLFALALALGMMVSGCALGETGGSGSGPVALSSSATGGGANAFNPYMRSSLPNTRKTTAEGEKMLSSLGGREQSIEGEAAFRKNWRDEIYPIVFGDKNAPHEIIVVLNFSNPKSASAWSAVEEASKSLSPAQCKIAVFGKSNENYGTDLMGLAIWMTHERPGQAMPWLNYALKRWNEVKAAQKAKGEEKSFINEYDATATAQDYPIHYGYLMRLNPPVPSSQQLAVAKYCYDAGNVNMYQANQICDYYGVKSLPAVIVDGKILSKISAGSILGALK